MRILPGESVPGRPGPLLAGHEVLSVQRRGWAGIKYGRLLSLASGEFDVLITADRGIAHQQIIAQLPIVVVIVRARSNRMQDMAPLASPILEVLQDLEPRTLHSVGA